MNLDNLDKSIPDKEGRNPKDIISTHNIIPFKRNVEKRDRDNFLKKHFNYDPDKKVKDKKEKESEEKDVNK
jgi:hypothetical protein